MAFIMLECAVCNRKIDPAEDGIARFQRGYYGPWEENEGFDRDNENVKFERILCEHCFLTDPDLCAFFNRINCRIR